MEKKKTVEESRCIIENPFPGAQSEFDPCLSPLTETDTDIRW